MVIDEQPPSFWNEFDLESHTIQIPLDRDSNAMLSDEWLSAPDLEERLRSFARSNEIRRKFNPSSSTNIISDHPTTASSNSQPLEELIMRESKESPPNQPLEEHPSSSVALEEKSSKMHSDSRVLATPSVSSNTNPTPNLNSSSQGSSLLSSPTHTSLRCSTQANKGI